MNHYERLKVSQDAPAEVIRAAYRTLAGKLHPDRQGADTGPNDEMHSQMAALNAAYEVLIDPKLRQDYDATLAPPRTSEPSQFGGEGEARRGPSTRVDMDWLTPKAAAPQGLWPPSKPMMVLGGSLLAGVLLGVGWFVWQMVGTHQMEQAMSDQYAAKPVEQRAALERPREFEDMPPLAVEKGAVPRKKPTVDELARMSDEELVKVLPTLDNPEADEQPARRSAAAGGASHHPLDGKPLSLRNDLQLVDPLAPAPANKQR